MILLFQEVIPQFIKELRPMLAKFRTPTRSQLR